MIFSHILLKRQEKRNYLSLWEMVRYSVYRKRPHHGRYPRSVWKILMNLFFTTANLTKTAC